MPRTDAVLADPALAAAAERLGRETVKAAVREAQERVRSGDLEPDVAAVAAEAFGLLPASSTSLREVLNATGVVLHTNLGRAPLSAAAIDALTRSAGTVDIEFDLATGARARRGRGTLEALAQELPDAADVAVVNNGAAALLLAVTVLAGGREVVVSRGELVEIGDGFRLPDLLVSTGARLREVGTTNRTALRDYADAVGPDTGCILKVHPSNFRITGFTSDVDVAELAGLGPPSSSTWEAACCSPIPCWRTSRTSPPRCATARGLVTASGDKLLGGPQAGIIAGDAALVRAVPPASAGPRVPGRQADARRPRGHAAHPADPDLAGAARRLRMRCTAAFSSSPPRRAAVSPSRALGRSAGEARQGSSCPAGRSRFRNAAPNSCAPAAHR